MGHRSFSRPRRQPQPRGHPLSVPLSTISAQGGHHALVRAWIAKHYSGVIGQQLDLPLGTVTTIDHHSLCTASHGAGGLNASSPGSRPTTDRQGLGRRSSSPYRRSRRWTAWHWSSRGSASSASSIGMRMLQPRELARAQGFPDSYVLTGTQREQVARIGNSVCPHAAAAVVGANWREAIERAA